MTDPSRTGHPRTLRDHEEMALRAAERQSANDVNLVAKQFGLRVGRVSNVGMRGAFQLEEFSDEFGNGPWFYTLNGTSPLVRESVVWAYVEGSPCVFGALASEWRPWRVPQSGAGDTYFFDEFDVHPGGGFFGLAPWYAGYTAGSGVYQDAGSVAHPGMVYLYAIAGVAANAYMATQWIDGPNIFPESLSEWEVMVLPSSADDVEYMVDLNDNASTFANTMGVIYDSTNRNDGWRMWKSVAGVYSEAITTPVVPVEPNHWYKLNFKHTPVGGLTMTVVDVTAEPTLSGVAGLEDCPSSVPMQFHARAYNLAASAVKTLYIDYWWWARQLLSRR